MKPGQGIPSKPEPVEFGEQEFQRLGIDGILKELIIALAPAEPVGSEASQQDVVAVARTEVIVSALLRGGGGGDDAARRRRRQPEWPPEFA